MKFIILKILEGEVCRVVDSFEDEKTAKKQFDSYIEFQKNVPERYKDKLHLLEVKKSYFEDK